MGKSFNEETLAFQLELCQLVIIQFIFSNLLRSIEGYTYKEPGCALSKTCRFTIEIEYNA